MMLPRHSGDCHVPAFLETRGLSKTYDSRRPFSRERFTVEPLKDINLCVGRGTTLAIVGESGAGKSTLARCLALLEKPTKGEILFEGQDLFALSGQELFRVRRRIQLIFQDPTTALNPRLTAGEIIAEPLVIQRVGTRDQQRLMSLELLERVGLPAQSARKRPLEFSGGQRQRLAIARALALEPSLLILDEALSSLDAANQQAILGLLAALRSAFSLTCIHICHDLRLISEHADEVAVMRGGAIVEHRAAADLFASPAHPYTQELLSAIPSLESICAERCGEVRA